MTARLVLHPLSAAEAERVRDGRRGDGVRWADGYPTEGDVSAVTRFLRTCARGGDPRPFGTYGIRLRADGTTVGGVDFHGPPDEDGGVTVGYGLVPSARGSGYASEALRGLLDVARAQGVSSVAGDTDIGNTASQRVMAAAGMRLVATTEQLAFYLIAWDGTAGRAPAGA
ncbi:GNAT family N-acetyltransferase [Actinacidiphila paucisporea]|uniref:Protein N-acetyltransferase, RimJ/RimL family n=1 Tax=Actinacidiphila paucisporea TaxID=310782 RepID=A0A1M7NKZ8_9ACTN|nr:GNAT family N-acetyltransferase [Actinacidiphila paucisporea]SHN04544.1 Protein N-acetyltransferase, RimJ/RimL family [Actinacidiphila paucisporea]